MVTKKSKTKRQLLIDKEEVGKRKGLHAMASRMQGRRQVDEEVRLNISRLKSLLRIIERKFESVKEFLDYALEEAISLAGSKIGYIYYYNEETKEFTLNTWSKGVMSECSIMQPETHYNSNSRRM